tara:strand:- start:137 stop:361 length:225 start_codon:yes stop_codon:yes gene_type:complete
MRKVILAIVFVFATGTSLINASGTKSNNLDEGPNLEYCDNFATEMAGILAIWHNNSFEEEYEDYAWLMTICMEQ